jgi:hypothetical protein
VQWAAAPEQRDHACPQKPVVADERKAARVSSAAAGAQMRFALGEGILPLRGGNGDRIRRRHKADVA